MVGSERIDVAVLIARAIEILNHRRTALRLGRFDLNVPLLHSICWGQTAQDRGNGQIR